MNATAIILAAGKGTRMNSDLPKVLHEVCERPMLGYVMDACRDAGCDRLLVVIGHQAQRVRHAFADDAADVAWVEQTEQLGTGHAVMVCEEQLLDIRGAVLVVAGDGPLVTGRTLRALLETHRRERASATLATCVLPEPGKYGRILRDEDGALKGIIEAVDATEEQLGIGEVNVSLYCFDASALRRVLGRLSNDNAKGEYYLTDALELIAADGGHLAAVAAVPPEEVVSINTPDELAQVEQFMRRRSEGEAT